MAERLNKKKPREEDEPESPSKALKSLDQPRQQEDSSPITRIHPLRLRAMGTNVKLPHIYRDYHVHTFGYVGMGSIDFMVPGDDIILVVHSRTKRLSLFRRHGDQISASSDDHGRPIAYRLNMSINSVCYNSHDNSFLIEYLPFDREIGGSGPWSLEIASIQAGQSPTSRLVFPGESSIRKWDFDIPMCRGMIHNDQDRKFKFFELKEYNLLFTIPDFGSTLQVYTNPMFDPPYFKSLSPGNMDMVMYETVSSSLNGSSGFQLRFYSKLNGVLRKEVFLPQPSDQLHIEFIALCGSDTLLMQQHDKEMEVVETSSENPVSIIKRRNTRIRAFCDPYYLHKRSQFICYTPSKEIHVCNLQGEILATLEDHPLNRPRLRYASLFVDSYISNSQDILISLCRRQHCYSVTVSSIVTGECLANITSEDPNCSEIRKAALNPPVLAFAYDGRTHEIFTGTQKGVCAVWSNKFYNDVGDVNLDEP